MTNKEPKSVVQKIFENVQAEGNITVGNITQILQISVDEIKTRQFTQISPYKGLKKFELKDKDLFFGRDQLITQLVEKLEHSNLILLLGASGSGKSSVVRAGLIPWLSRKWGSHFVHLTFTPDQDPFESLYASLLSKFSQKEAKIAREAKADTITQVVTKLKQSESFWFIFIDQFEELFTITVSEKRDNFINGLVKLSQTENNSVKIMGTMRADFLDKLSPYLQLIKMTDDSRPLIAEMQPDELRLAIEQPAAHHGVVFETGLVEEIIKNVQGQAGYLPLLQYTLNLLWETEVQTGSIHDRTLNTSTYRELGGVRGALQQHTDGIYDKLPELEKLAAKRIFLKLVGITGNSESDTEWKPVLKRALRSEFNDKLEQSLLIKLIDENLLVSDRQPQSQESTVEIGHEMLLTAWTTLNDWIKENRHAIALRNRLYDDVARWQGKKAEDELWAGSKLEQVIELRNDATFNQILGGFNKTASQFIDASVGLRDRQRRRAITGLASFSTVALFVAGFAVWQWQSAERRRIEQTAITAKNLLSDYPLQGMVSAINTAGQSRSFFLNFPNQPIPQIIKESLLDAVGISREKNRLDLIKEYKVNLWTIAISTDGQTILTGGKDGTVRMWNRNGEQIGKPFQNNRSYGYVWGVAISPDGQTILSGGVDGTIRMWNRNGQQIGEPFKGHKGTVYSVAISLDGQTILSGGADGTVRMWNRNGEQIGEPFKGHKGTVYSVAISPDGQTILSGGVDGTIRMWNRKGQQIRSIGNQGTVTSVAISTDGQTILSGDAYGTINILDYNGTQTDQPLKGHQSPIKYLEISTDGQTILSGSIDGTIRMWNRNGMLQGTPLKGHKSLVYSVAISTDGQIILGGASDGTVRMWNRNGQQIGEPFKGHKGSIWDVAISPDGQTILSGGEDATVRMWNRNGQQIGEPFKGHKSIVYSVAISADGQTIISGGADGTIRMWNRNGQQIGQPFKGHKSYVKSLAISADGQIIVSGSADGTVRMWNRNGQQIGQPFGNYQGFVWDVAISTDGQTIVSTGGEGDDNTVRMWNRRGQQIGQPFNGHQDYVTSVAISTDGQTILSGSADGTVRMWNRRGQQIGQPFKSSKGSVYSYPGNIGSVYSVAISTDGQTIISGNADATVKMWDIKLDTWLKAACERLAYHPVFKSSVTADEKEAEETCKPYLR